MTRIVGVVTLDLLSALPGVAEPRQAPSATQTRKTLSEVEGRSSLIIRIYDYAKLSSG